MHPKNTPSPLLNNHDEDYFGEFRELSTSILPHKKKGNEKERSSTDNRKSGGGFTEFSIFPKY